MKYKHLDDGTYDLTRGVIKQIVEDKTRLIFEAFECYGIDRKYILSHLSEFEVITDPIMHYEKYFHNNEHLFTFYMNMYNKYMQIEFFKQRNMEGKI